MNALAITKYRPEPPPNLTLWPTDESITDAPKSTSKEFGKKSDYSPTNKRNSNLPPSGGPPQDGDTLQPLGKSSNLENKNAFYAILASCLLSGSLAGASAAKNDLFGSLTKIVKIISTFLFMFSGTIATAVFLTRSPEDTSSSTVDASLSM